MAQKDRTLLRRAAEHAAKRRDERSYFVGAVGLRSDGAFVVASNGPSMAPCPSTHAEARLAQKLDMGATVWVARMTRGGNLALAKPCPNCERLLRLRGVERVVYSTGPTTYETLSWS